MQNFLPYPKTENELLTDFHNTWARISEILEHADRDFLIRLPVRPDVKNVFLMYFPPGDHPVFWLSPIENIKRTLCAKGLPELLELAHTTLNILQGT